MKRYQKAQIEARASKVPLGRIAEDLRRADQQLKAKATFIIASLTAALSLAIVGSYYFRPWESLSTPSALISMSPEPAQQIVAAPPPAIQPVAAEPRNEAPVLPAQIARSENADNAGSAAPVPETRAEVEPEEVKQADVLRLENGPRIEAALAQNPADTTASINPPAAIALEGNISDVAVATALSQLKIAAAPIDEPKSCFSDLRLLAKDTVVYFPPSGIAVAPQYQEPLKRLAEAARGCPEAKFDVAGHTDNTGEVISNLQLSWQRAEAAINFMKSQRFENSQFLPVGFSNARPASQDATSLGQAKNRRVEFVVR